VIDLHSHILPGIDDGAPTLDVALDMARIAVADGIETMACTPHIYPGLYMNDGPGIRGAMEAFQLQLREHDIALQLVIGADVHLVPGLVAGIREGRIPTLHGSRYLLLEPSHHVVPPRLEDSVFQLLVAGFVPVITHPERLSWIADHYETGHVPSSGGSASCKTDWCICLPLTRTPRGGENRCFRQG
jgi:protein-tyrosine phosphatase